jgi:CBS domain-containing protein/sporulation protein YlmC with PRC-barrel domain
MSPEINMNASDPKSNTFESVSFYLSSLLGIGVYSGGEKLGTLGDFVIVDKDKVAVVTHVCVERPFGRPALFVPWEKVRGISNKEAVLLIGDAEAFAHPLPGAPVLLADFILDKKMLDVGEHEVEIVYDIMLSLRNHMLLVIEVDISRYALLRRMGLGWFAKLLYRSSAKAGAAPQGEGVASERRGIHRAVPWAYVQSLPENIGSFKGDIKLKVLKDQLAKIAPVDVADILEELDPDQRMAVFQELETEHASDILESLNPKFQRDVVAALKKEKAAQLINEMTPGQAADLLAALPYSDAQSILKLLDPMNMAKILSILSEQEAKITNFADTGILKFQADSTVAQARAVLQRAVREQNRDVIMYLYVVDDGGILLGIVALSALLLGDDKTVLRDIMRKSVVDLRPENTMKEASKLFSRYGFRAIPVVDGAGKMLGVLRYRDVLNLRKSDFL